MERNPKKLFYMLIPLVVLFLVVRDRHNKPAVLVESGNIIVMNTIAKITAVAKDEKTARAAIDSAVKEVKRLEGLMNRYDPNSQLSLVNRQADKEPVKIDKDLFEIFKESIYYSELTNGAFDITVAPLIDLFRACAEANTPPTDQQLAEVKEKIGCEKILLDVNDFSIRLAVGEMKLDLGAIAKGYAADKAVALMKNCGATGGLVNLGGQIGSFGTTETKGKWMLGVQDPANPQGDKIITAFALNDSAIATSGNYHRFYTIAGKQYSHIFNPATETSADALSSVTIFAETGTAADALATAVSVMGAEKGLQLIKKLKNTEAIIIAAQSGETIKTDGIEKFLAK
ncbi:MAG: FAD:protein FMN transferase [Sedimentisphaerales bacterium]